MWIMQGRKHVLLSESLEDTEDTEGRGFFVGQDRLLSESLKARKTLKTLKEEVSS